MNPSDTNTINPDATSFPSPTPDAGNAFAAAPNPPQPDTTAPSSSTVTTTSSSSGGGSRRRVIMIAIAMIMMLSGLASGAYLITRNQPELSFAWDCELYRFDVSQTGEITVLNGSVRDLPAQVATVYIDGVEAGEFEVPALDSGESEALGVVTVPENGLFSWQVVGNKDCDQSGSFAPSASADCYGIKTFDEEWEPLSLTELSELESGDVVRFTIGGATSQGTFEMARFTINGELSDPVTTKRPGTDEFYIEYEIPEDVEDFTIDADLMHSELGWI